MTVNSEATYIGDGVYAKFDGYQVLVWTSNGMQSSRPIALEPEVLQALVDYDKEIRAQYAKKQEQHNATPNND